MTAGELLLGDDAHPRSVDLPLDDRGLERGELQGPDHRVEPSDRDLHGAAAGIPLERIRQALDSLPTERSPTRRDWERLSRAWRADIEERISLLEALRDRLTTCIGCGCLSIDRCSLLNPDDEAAAFGAGAHYLRRDSRRAVA